MSDIAPIGRPDAPALNRTPRANPAKTTTSAPTRSSDQVELSTAARMLSKLAELPDVRQNLIDQVRTQIADGTYETPQKIDTAIDHMAEDIL